MPFAGSNSRSSLPIAAVLLLLLSACAPLAPSGPQDIDWERHRQVIAGLDNWELSGRLNVRQTSATGAVQSDTVVINWAQQDPAFDLRLSGILNLGAVRVHGTPDTVTVEKAGEAPVTLPGLVALTREYFGFDFPTAQLLYWVRGIPDPELPAITTLDASQLLGTLVQNDPTGLSWTLNFDRYQPSGSVYLPGRIRVQSEGLQLTFLVNDWLVQDTATATR